MPMKNLIHRIKQRRMLRRAQKGTGLWGRVGGVDVKMPVAGDISARIIRADGSIEDLGVIASAQEGR